MSRHSIDSKERGNRCHRQGTTASMSSFPRSSEPDWSLFPPSLVVKDTASTRLQQGMTPPSSRAYGFVPPPPPPPPPLSLYDSAGANGADWSFVLPPPPPPSPFFAAAAAADAASTLLQQRMTPPSSLAYGSVHHPPPLSLYNWADANGADSSFVLPPPPSPFFAAAAADDAASSRLQQGMTPPSSRAYGSAPSPPPHPSLSLSDSAFTSPTSHANGADWSFVLPPPRPSFFAVADGLRSNCAYRNILRPSPPPPPSFYAAFVPMMSTTTTTSFFPHLEAPTFDQFAATATASASASAAATADTARFDEAGGDDSDDRFRRVSSNANLVPGYGRLLERGFSSPPPSPPPPSNSQRNNERDANLGGHAVGTRFRDSSNATFDDSQPLQWRSKSFRDVAEPPRSYVWTEGAQLAQLLDEVERSRRGRRRDDRRTAEGPPENRSRERREERVTHLLNETANIQQRLRRYSATAVDPPKIRYGEAQLAFLLNALGRIRSEEEEDQNERVPEEEREKEKRLQKQAERELDERLANLERRERIRRERKKIEEEEEEEKASEAINYPSEQEKIDPQEWLCKHYRRHCKVRFPCCERFYPCHRCHNESTACTEKANAFHATHLRCVNCKHEQEIDESSDKCARCRLQFSDYFCPICKHFTSAVKEPYHCHKCGICRTNWSKSFHCDVCDVCMNLTLKDNHLCRADSGHDECCICLEDSFGGAQILPCSHRVHTECAQHMIRAGIRNCPVCRQPLFQRRE